MKNFSIVLSAIAIWMAFSIDVSHAVLPGVTIPKVEQGVNGGVVVYREHEGQTDEFAVGIRFKSYNKLAPPNLTFDVGSGTPVQIGQHLVISILAFPDFLKSDLVSGGDKSQLDDFRSVMGAAIKKHPKIKPLLKEPMASLDEVLKKYDAGERRIAGNWLSAEEFKAKVDRENAAEKQKVQAQNEARQRYSEAVQNLSKRLPTMAGSNLLASYEFFMNNYFEYARASKPSGPNYIQLPEAITNGAIALPSMASNMAAYVTNDWSACDIGLREGLTYSAPAVIFAKNSRGCTAFLLAIPLKWDRDRKVLNDKEFQGAFTFLSKVAPDVAEWLPLGIASAITKVEFQRRASGKSQSVVIKAGFTNLDCRLDMTDYQLAGDGSLYDVVYLTVH